MAKNTQTFDPRQQMQRPNFEVFHYKDTRPMTVDVHHHDFYEVYFFLKGQVDFRVEGRIYSLRPGDLLLINPMELHQAMVREGDAYERIVLWVSKSYLEQFSDGQVSLTRCFDSALPTHTNLLRPDPARRREVRLLLEGLVQEFYGDAYGGRLSAAGLLLQFMVALNRLAHGEEQSGEQNALSSPLVSAVLDYIGEHYHEELTLEDLAARFYVSKYHLSHEFSRVVGTGLYRYIILKRLVHARQMLSVGISPGVVCANCGFRDYTNFFRAFKAQYGVSPRDCAPLT